MTNDNTGHVTDIDFVWWQRLADRTGETLLVLLARQRLDGAAEGCLPYAVTEGAATPWERRNAVARIVPGTHA